MRQARAIGGERKVLDSERRNEPHELHHSGMEQWFPSRNAHSPDAYSYEGAQHRLPGFVIQAFLEVSVRA
jgi:hypothetical protein